MNHTLRVLSERLLHGPERVAELFERDEVFRELCEEYRLCSETTSRLAGAEGPSGALRDEYVALTMRLEAELLRYLAEHPDA
jgi:hypothetical protein